MDPVSTPSTTPAAALASSEHNHSDDYDTLVAEMHAALSGFEGVLFTTSAGPGLYQSFLDGLPPEHRQHYTCRTCRKFVERFGGLVTISPDGNHHPALWGAYAEAPFFREALRNVDREVRKAGITGVFLSDTPHLGVQQAGGWTHLSAYLPAKSKSMRRAGAVATLEAAIAEKSEDFRMLSRAVVEYPIASVRTAVALLESEALYRSEKVLGVAKWFEALLTDLEGHRNVKQREGVLWRAVAEAPPGFTHIRSSMIGTLLDDLVSGMPFEAVKNRFAEKMHPLQYQRPSAPPTAGNLAQAEKLVEQLKAAGSLERRFARIEDIQEFLWRPEAPKPEGGSGSGVFAHIKPKGRAPQKAEGVGEVDLGKMTWVKFAETQLPKATRLSVFIEDMNSFIALTTAVNPEAPPILQWDHPERRNPVAWYVYQGSQIPSSWSLRRGWAKVIGVTRLPARWGAGDAHDAYAHQGDGAVLLVEGCRDISGCSALALFPETMKSEFHGIRSSIEAFSRAGMLQGYEDSRNVAGIDIRKGTREPRPVRIRIETPEAQIVCTIDRWD